MSLILIKSPSMAGARHMRRGRNGYHSHEASRSSEKGMMGMTKGLLPVNSHVRHAIEDGSEEVKVSVRQTATATNEPRLAPRTCV